CRPNLRACLQRLVDLAAPAEPAYYRRHRDIYRQHLHELSRHVLPPPGSLIVGQDNRQVFGSIEVMSWRPEDIGMRLWHASVFHASKAVTTSPLTSVRRKSRPSNR